MKIIALILTVLCSVGLRAADKKEATLPLASANAFPRDQREARSAVDAALEREGPKPSEYYAVVVRRDVDNVLEFQLSPIAARKAKDAPWTWPRGDSIGPRYTVVYDLSAKKVTKINRRP